MIILSEAPPSVTQAAGTEGEFVNYDDVVVNGALKAEVRAALIELGGGIMNIPHDAKLISNLVVMLPPGTVSVIHFNPVEDVNVWRSSLSGLFSARWKLILGHDSLTSLEFVDD